MPLTVLVVDDERNIRTTLTVCLEDAGCTVTAVGTGSAAIGAVETTPFDLAFVDLRLPDIGALDLLPQLLSRRPALPVVVITAFATVDTAVEAVRRGAVDYLPKPFSPAQIRHIVDRTGSRRALEGRVRDLEGVLAQEVPELDLDTAAPAMRSALDILGRAATSDATVLLRGENGTGKSLLAHALHRWSTRGPQPFVLVNCPTLSEELLSSELFGHVRGAFTGALRDQAGKVEAADGGTLFLDEIGEVSPAIQARLLRFLQDHEFERVGETRTRKADVRVVAATNRDLDADVKVGRFREDLLFRVNVVEVRVPPLRERREDIPRLARRFLAFFAAAANRPGLELSEDAVHALTAYDWPGNVRELRNAMERAAILWPADVVSLEALPARLGPPEHRRPHIGGDFTLEQVEREHLVRVVERARTLEDAARILGIESSTLWRKRQKLGI